MRVCDSGFRIQCSGFWCFGVRGEGRSGVRVGEVCQHHADPVSPFRDSGLGGSTDAARAEDVQGTPTQSHIFKPLFSGASLPRGISPSGARAGGGV